MKDFPTELKDLQEASKEASSVESLDECVKCSTAEEESEKEEREEIINDEEDNKPIEFKSDTSGMKLSTVVLDDMKIESGADSGTFTCSSLDGSFGSNSSLLRQAIGDCKKKLDESDTE